MDRSICYQEECAPGGCFMELAVQMVFIFVGKQFCATENYIVNP